MRGGSKAGDLHDRLISLSRNSFQSGGRWGTGRDDVKIKPQQDRMLVAGEVRGAELHLPGLPPGDY
jgi:hypothetical protein